MIYKQPEETKISIEMDGNKYEAILPWDCDYETLLTAFYGLTISATFQPLTALNTMKDFSNNNLEALGVNE